MAFPKNTNFVSDVLKLVSGTVLAQFLNIAAIPVLTRIYEPQAFGILALFTSTAGILGVFSCMRYEFAIMLPKSNQEAANLLGISLGFTTLVSFLFLGMILFLRHASFLIENVSDSLSYLSLLPLAIFCAGTSASFNHWNSRHKNFSQLSIAQVLNSFVSIAMTAGLGLLGYATGFSMIIGYLFGQCFSNIFLGYRIWIDSQALLLNIRFNNVRQLVYRYRKFPIYGIWSALLNTISWKLPTFILAAFFSPTVVGYYALAFRVLKMPMSLIGKSLSNVFFQRAAEAKSNGNLSSLVEVALIKLIKIGLFPIFILTIVGQDLYIFCFGTQWAEAGIYTQILSIWSFFWFISSPFSTLYSVLEKQNIQFKWNLVNFATRLLSLMIGVLLGSPRIALLLFSLTGIFVYGEKVLINLRISGVSPHKGIQVFLQELIRLSPAFLILILLLFLKSSIYVRLAIAVLMIILNYISIIRDVGLKLS